MKNKIYQLVFLISCLSGSLFGQMEVEEALDRASKQYDLYAFQMAMNTYKEVVKSAPDNGFAYVRIGDCLVQLNQPQEALKYYEQAVGKQETPTVFPLRYGKALMNVGNYAKAKRWFQLYKTEDRVMSEHFASVCDYAMANVGAQPLYIAKNEAINTSSSDFSPVFLGDKIVYSSSRADLKRTTAGKNQTESGIAKNQLFMTQTDKAGMLQAPAFYRTDLQNTFNEGPASFSISAGRVAFCRNNFVDGNRQVAAHGVNMSLYTADFVDGQWINIKAFPYNGSDFASGFPALSPDGNTLYFSSTRPNGYGGWDLYTSNWDGQRWSPPVNLGKDINTSGDEISAFPDGNNLFFSSDFHPGFGGLDVFKAVRGNDGQFSQLLHLGPGINSSMDDYGFVYNANTNLGYLTSNRAGGKGEEDIWKITKRAEVKVKPIEDEVPEMASVKTEEKVTVAKKNDDLSSMDFKTKPSKPIQEPIASTGVMETDAIQPNRYNKASEAVKVESRIVEEIKKPELEQGYSVQLAAGLIGGKEKLDENSFASLNEFGHVYSTKEGKYMKIKVGVYATEAEAESSLKKIVKKGHKSAFVSVEKNVSADLLYKTPVEDEEPLVASVISKPTKGTAKGDPSPIIYYDPSAPTKAEDLVFAVQLASMTNSGQAIDMSPYMALTGLGNLYSVPDSVFTKIRLGVWSSYDAAEDVKELVVKKGFKDAILVPEKAVYMTKKILVKETPKPTAQATKGVEKDKIPVMSSTKTKPATTDKLKATEVKAMPMYAVQIASLSNVKNLDKVAVEKIGGKLLLKKSGKMTLVFLADFDQLEDAITVKNIARNSGYKDAFVVKKEKDTFVKIKL